MPAENEHGFIAFLLGALLVFGLVIGVVVAMMIGLDNLYQTENDKSMFADDSQINQARAKLKDTATELESEIEARRAAANQETASELQSRRHEMSADERLADINKRLKAETEQR